MNKTILLLLLTLAITQRSFAQSEIRAKKNTLSIASGYFRFFNVYNQGGPPFPVTDLSYTRTIKANFRATICYSYFRKDYSFLERSSGVSYTSGFDLSTKIGEEIDISKLNYLDLKLQYNKKIDKHLSANIALGPSYVSYLSKYLESRSYIIRPDGSYHSLGIVINGNEKQAIGFVMSTGCNYTLWKDRISLGVELKGRYYPQKVPMHLLYAVQLGYNF